MDGDTDIPSVQQEFAAALYQLMRQSRRKEEDYYPHSASTPNSKNPVNINGGQQQNGQANGVAKHVIENGVNALANHLEKTIGTKTTSKLNGFVNNAKQLNGHQNGVANGANGAQHLLQNGVSHVANGNNRVAPSIANINADNSNDPLRNMYNEVEGYRQDLHI